MIIIHPLIHLHPIQHISGFGIYRCVVETDDPFVDAHSSYYKRIPDRDAEVTEGMRSETQLNAARRLKGLRLLILLLLCVLCAPVVNAFAQDFKTVAPGVEYAEVTREIDKQPVRMNVLRLDLTKVRLDVVHAMDAAIGLEKTSAIATRHRAFAAINGGFFRMDDSIWAGDPAGVLQINRKVWSEPNKDRIALLIFDGLNRQTIQIAPIPTKKGLLEAKISPAVSITISGINRERQDSSDVVLYTPKFHRTTLTNMKGIEIVVSKGVIDHTEKYLGNAIIPTDGFVLSVTGNLAMFFARMRKGFAIEITELGLGTLNKHGDLLVADDITNGVPQLIKDGKIDITWEQEKTTKAFVDTKHPRTAVAKLKDGKFLMITVDGRSESSGGISLTDLAAYLLELGATDAMNLDGGGSSTMFLDGKVVNHPSDKEGERKVSDAILVTLRPEHGKVPRDKH